jgi:hypothetical protein
MPDISNTFISGIMNKDLDDRLVPKGTFRDALNIDVDTSSSSNVGMAQNVTGNVLTVDLATISGQSVVDARTIGAITHQSTGLIYWFVASDFFDGIYEYNSQTGDVFRVLQSNKPNESTPSQLNFRKEFCITGVNYILGNNADNYLFWTDDYNPPRRINITRAKAYNVNDYRIDMDIDVILAPPLYAPSIQPFFDSGEPNVQASNMLEKFMYFSYRYKYVDGQYSSLSPFSAVAFGPKTFEYDYGTGNNKSMTNKYNSVNVSFETGNEFVEAIQLVVRDTKSINVSIIDTYSKPLLSIPDDSSFRIVFTNNKLYAALSQEQVTRLFDNVPLLAKAQDVVGNRIAYGNYVQFQDITDCNGDDINMNFSLSLTSTESSLETPKPTWRSDRDYEFGIVYLDDYGRMTTVLASQNNSINIPPANAVTANTISLRLSSSPPCWATHYRIVVKQPKKSYYNVFPIIFYENGLFRYFRIHESDKDKIRVGEYVIFKSIGDGSTLTNKKYKILEIESKITGFIDSNPNAIEGLYFKIKVDVSSELSTSSLFTFFNEAQGNNSYVYVNTYFNRSYPIIKLDQSFASNLSDLVQAPLGYVDKQIHYGLGDANAISSGGVYQGLIYYGSIDRRITIDILSPTTFRWTQDIKAVNGWIGPINIPNGEYGFFQNPNGAPLYLFYATFNDGYQFIAGDRWKINCKSGGVAPSAFSYDIGNNPYYNMGGIANYFGGYAFPKSASTSNYDTTIYGGSCIVTTDEIASQNIFPFAVIRINVMNDSLNSSQQIGVQEFISPTYYENIEEWFIESGAFEQFVQYDNYGNNINAEGVTFRRGELNQGGFNDANQNLMPTENFIVQRFNGDNLYQTSYSLPVHMIIRGYGTDGNGNINNDSNDNFIKCSIEIIQSANRSLCETVATETDVDIYHELFQTYPIVDNKHVVLWDYDDYQYVSGGPLDGKTRLTQLDSERPIKRPHYFNVDDIVYVNSSAPVTDGSYAVLAVENLYSIIIDLGFPGAGGITPGTVKFDGSLEQDQGNIFTPAVIEVNKPQSLNTEFSAWCWGNGLESDRIYDDFNQTEKDFSVRVTTPVEEYKQVRSEASICYSGIFKQASGINRLNEFNLSLSNFKYLDRDFGSIQKLYARNTDLVVFQQDKVSNVLYEKNVLFDSVGGGQVVSIPEVLGNQIPMIGEYGISNNPESFDDWGTTVFFTDARKGLVLQMENDQITEVSSWGMNDFFRDIMRNNPYTQKLGCYDPYLHKYVLAFNDQKVFPCILTLSRYSYKGPSTPFNIMAFLISTDTSWTISVQNNGYGTNWVSNYATSGFGSQNIFVNVAQNNTGFNRFVTFVVSYCDGLTQEFVLNQAKGKRGQVVLTVFNNPTPVIKH